MSALTTKRRNSLDDSAFVFPGERRYPIHDRAHARNALARAAGKSEESRVRAAVHSKYPDIGEKTASIMTYDMLREYARQGEKRAAMVKYTKKKRREDLLNGEDTHNRLPEEGGQVDQPNQIMKAANGDMLQYFADHPEKLREKKLRDAKKKHAMYDGFSDEMDKIAKSFMKDIGTRIAKTTKSWGRDLASAPGRTLSAAGDTLIHPVKTMKEGWHATWRDPKTSGGWLGKGMFALGTAGSAAAAVPKEDPLGRGESRLTRAARFAGGTALGVAGMKKGIIPSIALGIGGDVAGGYAGRGIDRLRGRKTVKPRAPEAD